MSGHSNARHSVLSIQENPNAVTEKDQCLDFRRQSNFRSDLSQDFEGQW